MRKKTGKHLKIFLIALLLITAVIVSGCSQGLNQTYRLSGKVVDTDFNFVEDARVTVKDTGDTDTTDAEGKFSFRLPPKRNYILTAEYNGDSGSINVDLTADKDNVFIVLGDLGSAQVSGSVNVNNQTSSVYRSTSSIMDEPEVKVSSSAGKPSYVEGEILVKYSEDVSTRSISSLETQRNLRKKSSLNTEEGRIVRYQIPEGKTVEEMVEYYQNQPGVAWAEPNHLRYASAIPNDPDYGYQEALEQWGHSAVNLEAAWDVTTGYNGIKVALIDSGILDEHPDLTRNINLSQGVDFVGSSNEYDPGNASNPIPTDYDPLDESPEYIRSHGTYLAGIIGADTNTDNSIGVAGVNWDVDIIPIRAIGANGSGTSYDIAEGIYYALDQNADIINLSLGSSTRSDIEREAINAALDRDTIIVASTGNGNENENALPSVDYPAAYEGVIGVGAVELYGSDEIQWANFSNYGSGVDLVAPGVNIMSTSGYYDYGQICDYTYLEKGTSISTAYVSGAAALLLANGVSKSAVYDRLIYTAVDLNEPGWDRKTGFGLLDVYGALKGKRLQPPKIFAGREDSNDSIYLQSEITEADSDGNYELTQVKEGDVYIYGWRDVNEDGVINKGDYFGRTDTFLSLSTYDDENVDLDIYYLSDEFNDLLTTSSIKIIKE